MLPEKNSFAEPQRGEEKGGKEQKEESDIERKVRARFASQHQQAPSNCWLQLYLS